MTVRIFEHEVGRSNYEVWITNGVPQYVIDGEIQHQITSVADFLIAAAEAFNRPNDTDDAILKSRGSINDGALENFDGDNVAFDSNGTSPSITLSDDGTQVNIGGGGLGGSLKIDFGSAGSQRDRDEAEAFKAFAEDLLGKATAEQQEVLTGIQIGDFTRSVTVSTRNDDITQIKFKAVDGNAPNGWADVLVEQLAAENGAIARVRDGNVGEGKTLLNPSQVKVVDGTFEVDLGSQGVGGKEVWQFASHEAAEAFRTDVLDSLGTRDGRDQLLDQVIETMALKEFGGTQLRDGNVSGSYEARQIKVLGDDGNIVDLGSHKVGGKERYEFANDRTALEFVDAVRDLVGVEAREGRVVDEFIYKVSGGAGISGSPTFVGKDDFIEFIGEEFGGHRKRDGSVSESYEGGGRIVGDGTEFDLGNRGVGGKEVWDFETAEDALAFQQTMADLFG